MPWVRARFKDKDIWAEVDASGALKVQGGRVPIRYSESASAKIYRGGAAGVKIAAGAEVKEISGGKSADAVKKSRGSGFGKAGTRTASQAAAAKTSALEYIRSLPEDTIKAFTDGACKGNPGPCGAGAVVLIPDSEPLEASRALGRGTNNIGELTAVGMALELMETAGVAKDAHVVLFTDSKYSLGVLTQGWKAKANKELISGIKAQLKPWKNLEIRWVAGHVGIKENERADQLAGAGMEKSRRM